MFLCLLNFHVLPCSGHRLVSCLEILILSSYDYSLNIHGLVDASV